jgi:hypothetical protein
MLLISIYAGSLNSESVVSVGVVSRTSCQEALLISAISALADGVSMIEIIVRKAADLFK